MRTKAFIILWQFGFDFTAHFSICVVAFRSVPAPTIPTFAAPEPASFCVFANAKFCCCHARRGAVSCRRPIWTSTARRIRACDAVIRSDCVRNGTKSWRICGWGTPSTKKCLVRSSRITRSPSPNGKICNFCFNFYPFKVFAKFFTSFAYLSKKKN